jgi:hypothetical protein
VQIVAYSVGLFDGLFQSRCGKPALYERATLQPSEEATHCPSSAYSIGRSSVPTALLP